MMTSMDKTDNLIVMPWFEKVLNPNTATHWAAKSMARKRQRNAAYLITKQKRIKVSKDGLVYLDIQFNEPDARKRDIDNMLASCKSMLDGIADALEVNDHNFIITMRRGDKVKGGLILIRIKQ